MRIQKQGMQMCKCARIRLDVINLFTKKKQTNFETKFFKINTIAKFDNNKLG